MRIPIIGGNWKMHRGIPKDAKEMLEALIPLVKDVRNVDIVIVPPFTALSIIDIVEGTNIKIGAQNMYFEEKGAFTGEISPLFLKEIGCEYVVLGHSERRDIFKENDELINKKLKKALSMELKPIVCIGEHLEDREQGKTKEIIKGQFEGTFNGISKEEITKIVIAYEPIWAIGTGKTATPEQADEVHQYIRELLGNNYDKQTAESVRIQYGGSVKPNNASELFQKENIDGGLVGGASLDANSFADIIKAAQK
ncbi:MAG: triose-phosphate isomerase [Candidatus Lokiarchaeota archaeon]|nr:triose-phosphate isomerase [Candidatus Lokiarchaeota archaeon]